MSHSAFTDFISMKMLLFNIGLTLSIDIDDKYVIIFSTKQDAKKLPFLVSTWMDKNTLVVN